MNKHLLSITMATCLMSCSDNSIFLLEKAPYSDRPVLQLSTRTFAWHSFQWEEPFEENARLNLYVVREDTGTERTHPLVYRTGKAQAIRQPDGSIKWETDPFLRLDTHPVRVYACYPYQSPATFSIASRTLRISSMACHTPDYRRGVLTKGHKSVSRSCPYALIKTEHLLSRLSFRLCSDTAEGNELYLQAIQVGNCPGYSAFCQEAVLDLLTGQLIPVTTHPGATLYIPQEPVAVKESFSETCRLRILPLRESLRDGEVEAVFTFNDRKYRYSFPAGTYWEKGYEYRYDFRLAANRLILVETSKVYM